MSNVVELRLDEPVRLDHAQLEVLYLRLGARGADQVVGQAMEDLAVELAALERAHRAGRMNEVEATTRKLVSIAQKVGMTALARTGRDTLGLMRGHDSAAYGAVVARMIRIGERSLIAVWNLQGATL